MNTWIITIDGPAGVGKSTVARLLADKLGAVFLDTGATYRAMTLAALNAGVDLSDAQAVLEVMDQTDFAFFHEGDELKVVINGDDATKQIRSTDVTENVRYIANQPALREKLVTLQRDFAARFDRVVTEGRDQGTVVFPQAAFKFFLTADPRERARRRYKELTAAGRDIDFDMLAEQIAARDTSDETRSVGPLKPAADAIVIDTTQTAAAGVAARMLDIIETKQERME